MAELVTFKEMQRRTKYHPEERHLYVFSNIYYPDFFDFYWRQFPDEGTYPGVRLSDRVNLFIQSTRLRPFVLSFDDFETTLRLHQEGLALGQEGDYLEISNTGSGMTLRTGQNIRIYSKADIDAEAGEVVFTPEIADISIRRNFLLNPKNIGSEVLEKMGFCQLRIGFPRPIRIEHLVGYAGYLPNDHFDRDGRPLWELDKFPVARVSYISEPESMDEHWVG
ncbi:hypothetical protein A3A14_03115 [Candidatus Daviesbacteria bacterium RIFCSPLOWO2_01_FULL_43_38]|uniref:Uncharacterized protein n=2 Tax=Candidatus Daviesiibacteriota TaxID=1752718 RepID=A0A1F5K0K5_9BACT|nr:MAG: hypothetical protein UV41_C0013G0004 [Candidatus Daviesbacteria bacterium GW2011_GWA2_42_7]OGE20054.1 MAG: hypothetical protein A2874_01065 [Candidatus Daviesbacteria bacterium RIFCSPHIGHO2_01_FULL_43_17]OGE34416.1 MAG: hypothetical protein A3E45_02990 [Candidatus Daviesbacteria bacterium RIFCSPHIGHO2_12_FULL_43_11]OGE63470.1 MAG: hypothetical protein A3A14_03115 [Candidatus Daviesbacteria bacterium RIFCSPLOWO2_01_FULL_43_38]OGE70817.1 MAG: hypothetical protein A3J21_00975 [Candidatus D